MNNLGDYQQSSASSFQILFLLLFLAAYAAISSFLEHKKLPLHRSAVATIIGILSGLILVLKDRQAYNQLVRATETIIFLVLFPPMVFAEAYTFKKGQFIRNIKYSMLFGIFGTFLYFVIVSGLLGLTSYLDLFRDAGDITNVRNLTLWEIFLLSACLCAIQPTAGSQIISFEKYPKLSSILKGEGIFKDCVTIVLFRAILRLQTKETASDIYLYWYTPFQIMGNFLILIAGSLLLGAVFGALTAFMFKKLRFISHDEGVTETTIMFLLGFSLYILSEAISLSGVISILCYGIILNRYNLHNLSQNGRESSKSTFLFVAIISEGLLFLIMGAMVWQADWQSESTSQMSYSWSFCLMAIIIILFARFVNIYVLSLVSSRIFKKFVLEKGEILALFAAGLPKGATTFALFTSVQLYSNNSSYSHNEGLVIRSTLIIIIILSCVVLNSLMQLFLRKPLKSIGISQIKDYLYMGSDNKDSNDSQKTDKNNKQMSLNDEEQEERQSNMQKIDKQIRQKIVIAKSRFRIFQEQKLKPLLIHRYEQRKQQIEQQKVKNQNQENSQIFNALQQEISPQNQQNSLKQSLLVKQNLVRSIQK